MIPKADKFLDKIPKAQVDFIKVTKQDLKKTMIEFAKLHVQAALIEAANEYYPKDKENFDLITKRFINAYPLTNIK